MFYIQVIWFQLCSKIKQLNIFVRGTSASKYYIENSKYFRFYKMSFLDLEEDAHPAGD